MPNTCGRRCKNCRRCAHRYTKAEYELWNCPECGEDRRCTQPVSVEGAACKRVHGGNSRKGLASATFQTGSHSKYAPLQAALPKRFEKLVEQVLANGELFDLSREVIVLRARFLDVLRKTDRGESEAQIKQALREVSELREQFIAMSKEELSASANRQADGVATQARVAALIKQHEQTLRGNLADWQTWNHAIDVAERTAGLVDKQDKRLQRARWFYSWTEVQRMFRALVESVNRHLRCALCPHCGREFALTKPLTDVQRDWGTTMAAFYAETLEPIDMKRTETEMQRYVP